MSAAITNRKIYCSVRIDIFYFILKKIRVFNDVNLAYEEHSLRRTHMRATLFPNRKVKGKLINNSPNTGTKVSMKFITSQFTGMKIGNDHQLPKFPKFLEVKQVNK